MDSKTIKSLQQIINTIEEAEENLTLIRQWFTEQAQHIEAECKKHAKILYLMGKELKQLIENQ